VGGGEEAESVSWFWITVALTVPTVLAAIVALPFWIKFDPVIGNVLVALQSLSLVLRFMD
jgi:hypothetical protein